ncbi:MAG: hypothetical protein JNJ58_08785 [Chitinophagaceae bacterium]|nr:hypothetical protein [Chitinophagaceae bacterium]
METTFNYTDYSQLTANTGIVKISAANTNLDGTGTTYTLITGAANGTLVNRVKIKAIATTTQGMVRFFLKLSGNIQLLQEVPIPACVPTAVEPAFECFTDLGITLAAGNSIIVSTEKAESFNVFAEGLDWEYPATAACCDHMNRVANNGFDKVTTANANLNGTGAIVRILTAGDNGTALENIHVKAQGNNSQGMIRLFISPDAGTTYYLYSEIQIPANRQTAIVPSTINFTMPFDFLLQSSYRIGASTEVTETFSIIIDGLNWKYA